MTGVNFAGTIFRTCVLAFFVADLANSASGNDAVDVSACVGSIVLFCGLMLFETEKIYPIAPVCFGIISLSWGLMFQPAILSRCHLSQWLLVIEAFHNLLTIDAHATFAWGHRVFGSIAVKN